MTVTSASRAFCRVRLRLVSVVSVAATRSSRSSRLPGAPKSSPLKNFANVSITIDRYYIKLYKLKHCSYWEIWKVSLHYLQNLQYDAAFSHGNLAVETYQKLP